MIFAVIQYSINFEISETIFYYLYRGVYKNIKSIGGGKVIKG